jgi:hypothetical protein
MGIWREHFHPSVWLRWEVLGWIVGILLAIAGLFLIFDQYTGANVCFAFTALLLFAKIVHAGVLAGDLWIHRALFTFVLCGLIGVGVVETVRGVNRWAEKKDRLSREKSREDEKNPIGLAKQPEGKVEPKGDRNTGGNTQVPKINGNKDRQALTTLNQSLEEEASALYHFLKQRQDGAPKIVPGDPKAMDRLEAKNKYDEQTTAIYERDYMPGVFALYSELKNRGHNDQPLAAMLGMMAPPETIKKIADRLQAIATPPVPPPTPEANAINLNWNQEQTELADGKPTVTVFFRMDGVLNLPAFVAICDRPCKPIYAEAGLMSHRIDLSWPGQPHIAGVFFDMPKPMPSGTVCKLRIISEDANPVRVQSFRILNENEIPMELK